MTRKSCLIVTILCHPPMRKPTKTEEMCWYAGGIPALDAVGIPALDAEKG